jgi:hypothetical protein
MFILAKARSAARNISPSSDFGESLIDDYS